MNALPLNFYDEVIHRLCKFDIKLHKLVSGCWSSTAGIHFNRRRELIAWLIANSEGTSVKVGVKLYSGVTEVPFEIDFKYDRIMCIILSRRSTDETVEETLEHFQTKTMPMIRSLASDCILLALGNASQPIIPKNVCDIIFDGLKDCSGLSDVTIGNYGVKCLELIRYQIEVGNLKALHLTQITTWTAEFQELIKVFVKSPKFRNLTVTNSNLTLDFDVVTCAFDRFFRGELSYFSLTGNPSFPVDDLRSLYPQFAVIPDQWPSQGSVAVWQRPQTEKKLSVTVSREGQVTVI